MSNNATDKTGQLEKETDQTGAGVSLMDQTIRNWVAVWQWPFAVAKYWGAMLPGMGENAESPVERAERERKEKKNGDVDEALDESFPASDPPSYNPGSAKPE